MVPIISIAQHSLMHTVIQVNRRNTGVLNRAGVETGVRDIRHQIIEERKERKQNMRDPNIHHG